MPVRLRITLLFIGLVFIILGIVCGSVYYFSYSERIDTIKLRLTNRAITTGRLLSQRGVFDQRLIFQIDSLTAITLKGKVVQVYDRNNQKIYQYSENPNDSLAIDTEFFEKARSKKSFYFRENDKEVIAYNYTGNDHDIVIISAARDADGIAYLLQLRNILLLSFFVGILIALVTGYFFSRKLLMPVKNITEDVSEISAQNLARRLSTGKVQDEWHNLANTLNELLNRLQQSFELQQRFISNASHELSTPLTSISSQLEVSLQKERSAEEYRKVMESIYQDVYHMGKLTQTLLEFAKASGNQGGLEINPIRIDEIILRMPSEIAKINPAYSVLLEFKKLPEDEQKLLVLGNEALLLTAIKNIILNACKYSENQQAVISLTTDNDDIVISVQDNGPGIPQKDIEYIFQPFYRSEQNRQAGGFGLGLSLAERIIKLHKGVITVDSSERGTRFDIVISPVSI